MSSDDIFAEYVRRVEVLRARERMSAPMAGEPDHNSGDEERLRKLATQIVDAERAQERRTKKVPKLRLVYSRIE